MLNIDDKISLLLCKLMNRGNQAFYE